MRNIACASTEVGVSLSLRVEDKLGDFEGYSTETDDVALSDFDLFLQQLLMR
jgi:hypothetical protein